MDVKRGKFFSAKDNPGVSVTHQWNGPKPKNVTFRATVKSPLSDFANRNRNA